MPQYPNRQFLEFEQPIKDLYEQIEQTKKLADKNPKIDYSSTIAQLEHSIVDKETNILDKLAEKEIVGIVTKLPPGFKNIFMLYVIEGYNHREIAELLGCSEGTCKSQFYRSRTRIQKLLKQSA